MKRISLTLTLASLIVLILAAPGLLQAQDTTTIGLQFVDCPDQITVGPDDSAYYRIQAAPVSTQKACPPIHYYLVSGPGMIDSLTGWWNFYPWLEDPAQSLYEVEVAAFFEGGSVLSEARCRFTVQVIGDETPQYTVRIEKRHDVFQGHSIELAVTLESIDPKYGLGGFDLLFAHDPDILTFQQAIEGNLYEDCGWEYFTYRFNAYEDCDGCPPLMVQVIGIAETNNGDVHPNPDCQTTNPGYVGAVPVRLFELKYLVTTDQAYNCVFAPVRFFWYDCSNNVLTDQSGSNLFVSSSVYGNYSPDPINDTAGVEFPTYLGAQEECSRPYAGVNAHESARKVVFYNGGVDIVCSGITDAPGDINVNGIAYEIADALMFARFFVEGVSAFGSHAEASIEQSDANLDGTPLTVEDFVYLARVVVGDAVPYSNSPEPPSPNTAYFSQDPMTGAVTVDTPDSLGAVQLVFEGEVGDSCLSSQGLDMMQYFDGEKSYVFLYTLESGKFITAGEVFACGPGGELIEAKTATHDAHPVNVAVGPRPSAGYAVRIGADFGPGGDGLPNHTYARVPVTLERADPEWGLGGFDLRMAYDFRALRFMRADEGSLLTRCGWEYFTYRYEFPDTNSTDPGLAQCMVVAIAETNDGASNHPNPDCQVDTPGWFMDLPDTLCYLYFSTVFDSVTAGEFHPVRFYWTDCTDNLLTTARMSHAGPLLWGSNMVYDYGSNNPINQTDSIEYPTFLGAQEECIDLPTLPDAIAPSRYVDFYNGGVVFAGQDIIDEIGDINDNGIAFEIADAVMFANYFTQDTLAFGDHVAFSTRASDVNQDRIPLTVEDFILLERVIVGEINPLDPPPPPSPHVAMFHYDSATGKVLLETPDTLGAVSLLFRGQVDGDCEATPGLPHSCGFDGEYTRVFIYQIFDSLRITSGEILTLPGDLELVQARTATYLGAKVEAEVGPFQPGGDDMVVRIEQRHGVQPGTVASLDVILEHSDFEIGGFHLMFEFNPERLVVTDVNEGSFFHECGWEYFTYRFGPYDNCGSACPEGYLQVVAIAEHATTPGSPSCYLPLSMPSTLASVDFLVATDVPPDSLFTPVRFFWWDDCWDNEFSNPTGTASMVARNVYDLNESGLIPKTDTFPTYAPQCIDPIIDFLLVNVDFINGGISVVPPDTSGCDPGDMNGNGVPYEIADAVLYTEYYADGWGVFSGMDSACVVSAMDVNEDGEAPTVADLVFLIDIVVGDALPYDAPPPSPNPTTIFHDEVEKAIYAQTVDTLGAIYLRFDGIITPDSSGQLVTEYYNEGNTTSVTVTNPRLLEFTDGRRLFVYDGAGQVIAADACTIEANSIPIIFGAPTDVDPDGGDALPTEFALDNNYPNPFNPSTNIQYHVPHGAHVEIAIFNIRGQRVKTLVNESKSAGVHTVVWDGTSDGGNRVASGMYFYRMTAGDYTKSRKMILLK